MHIGLAIHHLLDLSVLDLDHGASIAIPNINTAYFALLRLCGQLIGMAIILILVVLVAERHLEWHPQPE